MKLKFNWILFVLSFFSIIGVRIFQISSIGNPTVRMQWNNLEMICFFIAVVAFVLITILSYLSKDAPNVFIFKKNAFVGLISVLTAAATIWNSVYDVKAFLNSNSDWVKLVSGVLGIFSGIVFVLIALSFFKEKNYLEKYRLFTLIPAFWSASKVLTLFFAYNSVPTNILNVSISFAEVFLLFFLFAQARLFSELFNYVTFKKLFYFGFSAALFITVTLTNDLAVALDTGRKFGWNNISSIALNVLLILYILAFILAVKCGKNLVSEKFVEEPTVTEPSDNTDYTAENVLTEKIVDNSNYNDSAPNDMDEVDKLIEEIESEKTQKI